MGFINVDKLGNPDVKHDLEMFPWPWDDNSVDEILMNHVLEHLGETSAVFLNIMRELYRICKPGAKIEINCPHPRHDDFISDPTHVRAITPRVFDLFSKKNNKRWAEGGFANSQLALYLDVDFEVKDIKIFVEPKWEKLLNSSSLLERQRLNEAIQLYNNVVKETRTILKVVK